MIRLQAWASIARETPPCIVTEKNIDRLDQFQSWLLDQETTQAASLVPIIFFSSPFFPSGALARNGQRRKKGSVHPCREEEQIESCSLYASYGQQQDSEEADVRPSGT